MWNNAKSSWLVIMDLKIKHVALLIDTVWGSITEGNILRLLKKAYYDVDDKIFIAPKSIRLSRNLNVSLSMPEQKKGQRRIWQWKWNHRFVFGYSCEAFMKISLVIFVRELEEQSNQGDYSKDY